MKGFKHFFSAPRIAGVDLAIRGIGVREGMKPCVIDRPAGTGDYLFMLFHDPARAAVGKDLSLRERNTLMIWTPGMHQYYGNPDAPFSHTWIHCDGAVIGELLKQIGMKRNECVRLPDPALMERHMLAIHDELARYAKPDGRIIRNLLENWMLDLKRSMERREESVIPTVFMEARHFIESEYARRITLRDLADKVHLSVPHFCAQFRRYFGMPAIECLIRHRMHRAAYHLANRNLTVSEVAGMVGYDDIFHFSKLFKKQYGMSPRAMRASGRRPAKTRGGKRHVGMG